MFALSDLEPPMMVIVGMTGLTVVAVVLSFSRPMRDEGNIVVLAVSGLGLLATDDRVAVEF